jgi:succinyl-diaminopimelate desuccinylase
VNARSSTPATTPSPAPTLDLARELIARKSPTPDDAGCQDILRSRLEPLGFRCETIASNGV